MMILLAYLFVDMPKRFRLKPTNYYRSALHYREAIKRRAINCKYIPVIIVLGLFITVASIQKDMGTAIITLMICVACFFGSQRKNLPSLSKFYYCSRINCINYLTDLVQGHYSRV